jgi:hypothetical protein
LLVHRDGARARKVVADGPPLFSLHETGPTTSARRSGPSYTHWKPGLFIRTGTARRSIRSCAAATERS